MCVSYTIRFETCGHEVQNEKDIFPCEDPPDCASKRTTTIDHIGCCGPCLLELPRLPKSFRDHVYITSEDEAISAQQILSLAPFPGRRRRGCTYKNEDSKYFLDLSDPNMFTETLNREVEQFVIRAEYCLAAQIWRRLVRIHTELPDEFLNQVRLFILFREAALRAKVRQRHCQYVRERLVQRQREELVRRLHILVKPVFLYSEENAKCKICRTDYGMGGLPEAAAQLPRCKHTLGRSCLASLVDMWRPNKEMPVCPVCREDIGLLTEDEIQERSASRANVHRQENIPARPWWISLFMSFVV